MTAIYPIVEGHADAVAVPMLLRRIASEMLGIHDLVCFPGDRVPRGKLLKTDDLSKAIRRGRIELRHTTPPHLVLVLMDADGDCPVTLRSTLIQQHGALLDAVSLVFVVCEFEAWFLAANMNGTHHRGLRDVTPVIAAPEAVRNPKAELEKNFLRPNPDAKPNDEVRYSEVPDQAKFTAAMDLVAAQTRSPSFGKLVRDLRAGLIPPP
jgi:hypothetical protein